MSLRPYQQSSSDAAVDFMEEKKSENGLLVVPTGGGKSHIIQDISQRLGGMMVIFQPSKEILEQNLKKLRDAGGDPAVFSASVNRRDVGRVTLATIGSVKNYSRFFTEARHVIIDECHLVNAKGSMYMDFLDKLPDCRVLGLTATPYRLASDSLGGACLKFLTRTRPRVFSKVVHVVQNRELFGGGYLCPLEYRCVPVVDASKLLINSTGADYDDRSVFKALNEVDFSGKLREQVLALLAEGRKSVLVFTRFTKEAEELAEAVGGEVVTAETDPRERESIQRRFKAGTVKVVANVGVYTVGFDFPELDTVVLARHTLSLALFYQMVGRAVRTAKGKSKAVVVDMVGLTQRFGRVEDLELVDQGHGKWVVQSQGRQLTNNFLNGAHHPLLPDFQWGEARDWLGSSVREARPNSFFWVEWRVNREELEAAGISVTKTGTDWVAVWREAKAKQAQPAAAAPRKGIF